MISRNVTGKKLNFIGNGPFQQKRRYETVPVSKSDRGSDRQTLKSKIEQGGPNLRT